MIEFIAGFIIGGIAAFIKIRKNIMTRPLVTPKGDGTSGVD